MSASPSPNPLRVASSIAAALRRVRPPAPTGTGTTGHDELGPVLDGVRRDGVTALPAMQRRLRDYRDRLQHVDPDRLDRNHALAYWVNLYNAGALDLAAATVASGMESVLRLPGGFQRPWAEVAGESLSLDAIEHAKIRRFGDPRIHGALVCGSASCPTLRYEPYDGAHLDEQLDAQLRSFLISGGARPDRESGKLVVSRVLLWYGGDFTRPHRMPAWLPAGKRRLLSAVTPWLDPEVVRWTKQSNATLAYQPYSWSLACAVR